MKEVKIGNQIWSKENLNEITFLNGDKITLAKNCEEWEKLGEEMKPACAYLAYDEKNGKKFGLLYNFYAVTDKRGLAPEGWAIPTCEEYEILIKELGGEKKAGKAMKMKKKWEDDDCSDSSGFSAVPSCFHDQFGFEQNITMTSCFWTSSKEKKNDADYLMISCYSPEAIIRVRDKSAGFSIRCLKK